MAGYVKLQRSIWQDADFIALHADEQRTYMLLISQGDISHAGILPLTPGRWARLSNGATVASTRASVDKLVAANFLQIDEETEEVLVRSYLVHDEAYKLTNGTKSLLAAYERVLSPRLQRVVAGQLATVGVTVPSTVPPRVEVSQQTAAIPLTHEPAASSPTEPESADGDEPHPGDDVAAAALSILIEHRVTTTAKTNPEGLRFALQRDLPDEHGKALGRYLTSHPDATAEELAANVLNVPGLDIPPPPPAWYADPHCEHCPGDGTANLAPEGAAAEYGPCPCRRPEPYPSADVIPFNRKDSA